MKIAEEMLTLNDGRTLVLRSAEEKDAVTMLGYIKQTAEETHYLVRYGEKLIRESGHTVPEVSEYLGASPSLVYRYLRGEVLPSIDRIVALSVYLEVPIDDIIAVD